MKNSRGWYEILIPPEMNRYVSRDAMCIISSLLLLSYSSSHRMAEWQIFHFLPIQYSHFVGWISNRCDVNEVHSIRFWFCPFGYYITCCPFSVTSGGCNVRQYLISEQQTWPIQMKSRAMCSCMSCATSLLHNQMVICIRTNVLFADRNGGTRRSIAFMSSWYAIWYGTWRTAYHTKRNPITFPTIFN